MKQIQIAIDDLRRENPLLQRLLPKILIYLFGYGVLRVPAATT